MSSYSPPTIFGGLLQAGVSIPQASTRLLQSGLSNPQAGVSIPQTGVRLLQGSVSIPQEISYCVSKYSLATTKYISIMGINPRHRNQSIAQKSIQGRKVRYRLNRDTSFNV